MHVTSSEKITAHLYPWDVNGDPDAAARLVDAGVTRVALAASYHAVRAATPHHPRHKIVEAPHGAAYVAIRAHVWEGHELVPQNAEAWAGADSFVRAREALAQAGLRVAAWSVLTHSCSFESRFAEHTVRNAFGDRFSYALCPARPEVREYAATLVTEIVLLGQVEEIVLEAAGQLGFEHGSAHEKTAGADWSPAQQALLSICFCTPCERLYTRAGIEPAAMRSEIADALADAEAAARLRARLSSVVPPARAAADDELLREVVSHARAAGARDVTVFADPDPWTTGATITPLGSIDGVDRWLLPCFGDWQDDAMRAAALARLAPAAIAAYVSLLTEDFSATIDDRLAALSGAGISSVHGYHYGLASQGRIDTMTAAFERSSFSGRRR